MHTYPITIRHLYISPGHNYFGHPKGQPGGHPTLEVSQVEVRARQGLVGDRFFGKGDQFDGHVTFFAWEVWQLLRTEYALAGERVAQLRRNVVTEGVNLNQLIGHEFAIGAVRFRGAKHCAPCRWMDMAVAPGALKLLHGRGGLRAQALSDGLLQSGPATLTTAVAINFTTLAEPLPTPKLP
jgi:MOSC domain-containing protein YiiM